MSEQMSLLETGVVRVFAQPKARRGDLPTAHEARNVISKGSKELDEYVRRWVFHNGPHTAFQIAEAIRKQTTRWQADSIRSSCSRTLVAIAKEPKDPNKPEGRKVAVYGVMVDSVELPA